MDTITFTGALEDTRSQEEKDKDYQKLVMAGPIVWKEKKFEDVWQFPVRDQDGSGTCVMQTGALVMGIENFLSEGKFIEFSVDLYNYRSNEGAGMIGIDALELLKKRGLTLEVLIPSMKMGESQIAELKRSISDDEIGEIFTIKDYYQIPFSADAIANVMEMKTSGEVKKPLMVWFQFPRAEWNSAPKVTNSNVDIVRHSVTARYYGMMNGIKGIFIQDSWGLHSTTVTGLRFISDEYIKARMIFCAYVNDQPNDWQDKNVYNFNRVMKRGMKGEDIVELQKLLNINPDGDFGPMTERVVKEFQSQNGLLVDGIAGPATLSKLLNK